MDKEQKFVSVVAYMRNTGDGAAVFLDTVMGACSAMFEKCELVLIDDCSDDGSAEAVREYCRTHSTPYMVSILKTSCPQGLESSMNAGRDIAIGDYVYEFDDMFVDYPADVIEKAYRKCLEGCDIVSDRKSVV